MATSTFSMGDWSIGVRTNSEAFDDALCEALAPYYVGKHADAPPNITVKLAEGHGGRGVRELNVLYWAHADIVRSRAPRRVVEGLLHMLVFRGQAIPDGLLQVTALALVKDGKALLVPAQVRYDLAQIERRLGREGIRVVDTPFARLDERSGELIVPEPSPDADLAPLAPWLTADADPPVAAGRYPVRAWALTRSSEGELPGPISRATGLLRTFGLVRNHERLGGQRTLAGLKQAFEGSEVMTLGDTTEGVAALFNALLSD